MTDVRHAFSEATAGFVDGVLSVPDDAWSTPGLGVWTVRDLVGHTSRAFSTIESYLGNSPAGATLVTSPVEYYRLALGGATQAFHDAIAERGRQSAEELGDDIVSGVRALTDRVLDLVERTPDDAICGSAAGAMRLIDYLPTRVVELTVHCIDLTDALDRPPTVRPSAVALTASIMSQVADPLMLIRSLGGRGTFPEGYNVFG